MLNSDNYFAIFGLEPKFNIDEALLRKRYYALQQQVHPDSFDSNEEQAERAMAVNEAYYHLVSPINRARHLLQLSGMKLDEEDDNLLAPEPVLLMELIEIREAIEGATTEKQLLSYFKNIEHALELLWKDFADKYDNHKIDLAAKALVKAQYWVKLIAEIKQKISLLGYNHAN